MSEINDCPACGTSLNCSGCGEDIQNIVEQSALLKEKDAEITALKAKIHRMSKCFYFWDQYEGQYRGQHEA